jgi:hypothetical protein
LFLLLLACLIISFEGFTENNLYDIIIIIINGNMFAWLTGTDTTPPALLEIRSSQWLIISTVAAAVFTDVFLYGIIVPVLYVNRRYKHHD